MEQKIQGYMLSTWQAHLWQSRRGEDVLTAVLEISASLNRPILGEALELLALRHEALNTVYERVDGDILQVPEQAAPPVLEYVDLSALDAPAFREKADQIQQDLLTQGPDLEAGPLLRAVLLQSSEKHELILAVRAVSCDPQSMNLLANDLEALYNLLDQEPENVDDWLAEAPPQYLDYVDWLQEVNQDEDAQKDWWVRQTNDEAVILNLQRDLDANDKPDLPKPAMLKLPAATASGLINSDEAEKILLTGWQVLLNQLTNAEQFTLFIARNGRRQEGLEGLVGPCTLPLPMTCHINPGHSFNHLQEVIGSARDEMDSMMEYYQPADSSQDSHTFGFACLQLEPISEAWSLTDITLIHPGSTTLQVLIQGQDVVLRLNHDHQKFEAQTADIILDQFAALLTQAMTMPTAPISQLQGFGPLQQKRLDAFNNTREAVAAADTFVDAFETQVQRTPHAPAVRCGGDTLSYEALNVRANRLAHYLKGKGAGAEKVVGLCLNRSTDLLTAVAAVLKSGAAYLPLDPNYPDERLTYMIGDSKPLLLLTQNSDLQRFGNQDTETIDISQLDQLVEGMPQHSPLNQCTQENLAYVIYTSGSTGKPKGSMIHHGGLINFLSRTASFYNRPSWKGAPLHASISFDASVFSLFTPLICGRFVELLPEGGSEVLEPLLESIGDLGMINMTASHMNLLRPKLEAMGPRLDEVVIILGGEELTQKTLRPWQENLPNARFVNEYGPCEASVGSTAYVVSKQNTYPSIPIGQPNANIRLYLLDKNLQPVAFGKTGELYIAGLGLGRGYRFRPALTADRFIPNPFATSGGERLYRTGDRATLSVEGEKSVLIFQGRNDDQVKIRGVRIELGEIEAAMAQHPDVASAVVLAEKQDDGRTLLVGFYTLKEDGDANPDLRTFLADVVPDFMIPNTLTSVASFPLTANGKVDRAALLKRHERHRPTSVYVAPSNQMEADLAEIWAKTLNREQVGVNDNFFELGGDSILSIQIANAAARMGLFFRVDQLFKYQTITRLAEVVDTKTAVTAEQGPITGEVPLIPIQQWFFENHPVDAHHWNQSQLLALDPQLSGEQVSQLLQAIMARHDSLRLQFPIQNGQRIQLHAPAGTQIPLRVTELDAGSEEDIADQIERLTGVDQAMLNLEAGPLCSAHLLLTQEGNNFLFLATHHLVVDAVSWRILMENLNLAAHQLLQGQVIDLGPKTTAFRDWALFLEKHTEQVQEQDEVNYWLAQRQHQIRPLRADHPHAPNTRAHLNHLLTDLDPAATDRLFAVSGSGWKPRVNELLIAALVQSITQWQSSPAVAINLEGHGREHLADDLDLSQTTGWFTTSWPVCFQSEPAKSSDGLLRHVKQQLRDIPKNGIGFGLLRYFGETATREQLASLTPPSITFNYLGKFDNPSGGNESEGEQPVMPAGLPFGPQQSDEMTLTAELTLNCWVEGGQLHMNWLFSGARYNESTMEQLSADYKESLHKLTTLLDELSQPLYTPNDFPLAGLDQVSLDRITQANPGLSELYPLSPVQEGMLFHHLYEPEKALYFTQPSYEFEGEVDVDSLQAAWRMVADRHAILRTRFIWKDLDRPLQLVEKASALVIHRYDMRELDPATVDAQVDAFLLNDRSQNFKLDQEPPIRLSWLALPNSRGVLVWSHHHMLLDAWSRPILQQEVFAAYHALTQNQTPEFKPVQAHFGDFITWLENRDRQKEQQFWQGYLGDLEEPTELPKRPVPASRRESQPAEKRLDLDSQTTTALGDFARRNGLTLNTLIQGAWSLLLSRYARSSEVTFGVVVAGRPAALKGGESIIGLFINTLPLRVKLTDQSLVTWLKQLQETTTQLRDYEATPLSQARSFSGLSQDQSLFESIFVFENAPKAEAAQVDGDQDDTLAIAGIKSFEQTHYPLSLVVIPGENLHLRLCYQPAQFEDGVINGMSHHLGVLLKQFVRADQPLSNLTLNDAEQSRLLQQWSQSSRELQAAVPVHQTVAQWAQTQPHAPAIIGENQTWNYGELDRWTTAICHQLGSLAPETPIGVCLPRSPKLVAAMLAVFKSGGIYIPIDTKLPAKRIQYLIQDAKIQKVLLDQDSAEFFENENITPVFISPPGDTQSTATQADISPQQAAYVIYTSGSTGLPKGVGVSHGALAGHCRTTAREHGLDTTTRMLVMSSFSFDVSLELILENLISGGSILLAGPEPWLPEEICQILGQQPVTHLNLVPAYWQQLIQAWTDQEKTPKTQLQRCMVGGDALPRETLRLFQASSLGHVPVVNCYGPTETVITATIDVLEKNQNREVTIGKPLPGRTVQVWDTYGNPQPPQVPGELIIGGSLLARGYQSHPSLTAERFVPDPNAAQSGARAYRTGDLVRFDGQGRLVFLGRIDRQIKVRGFRIEPGEIEAALERQPGITTAAVILNRDERGTNRLIGYYSGVAAPDESSLRDTLGKELPDYMVPAFLVALDKFPLLPSGKVDRKSLPLPEQERGSAMLQQPRNQRERILAEIWAQVLGLKEIGIHQSFFELGGDSILSIQAVSRARKAGLIMTVRQIFDNPTLAALAPLAREKGVELLAEQDNLSGEVPLGPIQAWFFEQDFNNPNHYNQSQLLITDSKLETAHLQEILNTLVTRHDMLRARYVSPDGHITQVIDAPREIALETIESDDLNTSIEKAAKAAQASLSLNDGPVFRALHFRDAPNQAGRLLLVAHHLVIDGVSWRILLEELETLGQQALARQDLDLGPKTTSFPQWNQLIHDKLKDGYLSQQLPHWEKVAQITPAALPIDHPEGENTVECVENAVAELQPQQTKALMGAVGNAYGTRIDELLLTALSLALRDWSGSPDQVFQMEGHGREEIDPRVDLSHTIGWFTSLYPVHLHLGQGDDLAAHIKSVKEQLRAIPNKGFGYSLLHRIAGHRQLQPKQALPLVFNYLGRFDGGGNEPQSKSLFASAPESAGHEQASTNVRAQELAINCWVSEGRLQFVIGYSAQRFEAQTVDRLAQGFIQTLAKIVEHCLQPQHRGYTPSDFPLAKLDQPTLDRITQDTPSIENIYPLSPMQLGMLFHALYAPDSGMYGTQTAYRFEAGTDPKAFEAAWNSVVSRHAILRTTFVWEGLERPLQRVHKDLSVPIHIVDWKDHATDNLEEAILGFMEEDRRKPFQFNSAPPIRLTWIQLPDDSVQFVWTYHHMLLDAWSMPIVKGELMDAYAALAQNRQPEFAGLESNYGHFIDFLEKRDQAVEESFWKSYLHAFEQPTCPVIGQTRLETANTSRTEGRTLTVSPERLQQYKDFSQEQGATLNNLFQVAWGLLLGRYAQTQDVVFGITVSGRPAELSGVEQIVGLFINTLPIRVQWEQGDSPQSLLSRHVAQANNLRAHESSSLSTIQGLSSLPSGTPLFNALLVFENAPQGDAQDNGQNDGQNETQETLRVSAIHTREQTNYPLSLVVIPGEQLTLRISYDANRLEAAQVDLMLERLTRLMDQLIAAPEQPIAQLSLLEQNETQTLHQLGRGQELHSQADVVTRLQHMAQRQPQSIAVIGQDHTLTYAQLDQASNQLAHHLMARGIEAETSVGVMLERSPELQIAFWAVLKAGGAYVPLDVNMPAQRLNDISSDTQMKLVISTAAYRDQITPDFLNIADPSRWTHEAKTLPQPAIHSQQTAYMIFTSGSTGKPKGVSVSRDLLARHCQAVIDQHALDDQSHLLFAGAAAFDMSLKILVPPLLAGGRLTICGPQLWDGETFWQQTARSGFTHLNLTPAWWAQLVRTWQEMESGNEISIKDLKLREITVGGDVMTLEALAIWNQTQLKQVKLFNCYGPTETVITATQSPVQTNLKKGPVPIGKALPGRVLQVLDEYDQSQALGIPGQLWLGGPMVARGYHNRPALTAERFMPDPHSDIPGARRYRTGDQVRMRPDGALEFIGRLDNQVQLRGFRIELGEIEAALDSLPQVAKGLVRVWKDNTHEMLSAYVLLDPNAAASTQLDSDKLSQQLAQLLPGYMVPGAFTQLQSLPLNLNGKIDRKALPKPSFAPKTDQHPRTPEECTLAEIWCDVLRLPKVGIHDDFFALGGDSIISIQIVGRAARSGLQLSVKQIFSHKTIAALAQHVDTRKDDVLAEQGEVTGQAPLMPIQSAFFQRAQPSAHHYNQSYMLEVAPQLTAQIVREALEAVLTHHDALRFYYPSRDGRVQQEHRSSMWLHQHFPFRSVVCPSNEDLEQTIANEANLAQSQFNLAEGPLFAAVCFHTPEQNYLLIVAHHLLIDGVSWRILLEDLSMATSTIVRGETVKLPPKTTSFRQWGEALTQYVAQGGLDQQRLYWKKVAGVSQPSFPVDHPNGTLCVAQLSSVTFDLNAQITEQLLKQTQRAYNTEVRDLLCTALTQTLVAWTGSPHVLIHLEGHGREQLIANVDLSRTIGWFTSLFPVLLGGSPSGDIAKNVMGVKNQLRSIPDKGIGYGLLRYLCEDKSDLAQAQPSVVFNYLGRFDSPQAETDEPSQSEQAPFTPCDLPTGANLAPENRPAAEFTINCWISEGRFQLSWTYSKARYQDKTVETLVDQLRDHLQAVIQHCMDPANKGYTPSDFPLAQLDQDNLDRLLASIEDPADIYPLAPLQAGMLYHGLRDERPLYFNQPVFFFESRVNLDAMTQAWHDLADRHPILRTTFHLAGIERPVQVVRKDFTVKIKRIDQSGLEPNEVDDRLAAILEQDRMQGFESSLTPPWRLTWIDLPESRGALVWSHHHVLTDAWSFGVLQQEIALAYGARVKGQIPEFQNQTTAYKNFIQWLEARDRKEERVFWQDYLQDTGVATPLTIDQLPLSDTPEETTAQVLDRDLPAASLMESARSRGLTLNTLVQGAWSLILNRYSGKTDITFGVTVSGRPTELPGIDQCVGLFINTLPMRVKLPQDQDVNQWLVELQANQLELSRFEHTPLAEISTFAGRQGGEPLFHSIMVFENAPSGEEGEGTASENDGLDLIGIQNFEQTNFPITLVVLPGKNLRLRIMYDPKRFEAATITRMLDHLANLLHQLGDQTQRTLRRLEHRSQSEQETMLKLAHSHITYAKPTLNLNQRFTQIVAQYPDQPAVTDGQETLNYRQLQDQVYHLAQVLKERGIKPGTPIALCLPREASMVTAILAVLQAGACYVPLDPHHPRERMTYVLQDSQAPLVLATAGTADALPEGTPVLLMETCLEQATQGTWQPLELHPQNLAYIIYTSGSTGQPKGVAVSHANAAHLMAGSESIFDFNHQDVWTLFHSYAFDFSVWELWGAIWSGGRVVVVPFEVSRDPNRFHNLLVEEGVTVLNQTPTAFYQLLACPTFAEHSNLKIRTVIFGGEALTPNALEPWYSRYHQDQARLVNMYGITETTVHVTWQDIQPTTSNRSRIGGPMPQLGLHVLDQQLAPQPIGIVGEFFVSGAGLAQGYLNNPRLTAQRFIPDPFAQQPGSRLYRSGDLGRFLPSSLSGNPDIEYLGRGDNQVKIRGFRIELGEIEAVIGNHQDVNHCSVLCREDRPGDKRLVAYVQSSSQDSNLAETLLDQARNHLPVYMVPAAVVIMEQFPLTANGKLDRKSLPRPEDNTRNRAVIGPRNQLEYQIWEIFNDLLETQNLGIDDNFFELGGHSLLAVTLQYRLKSLTERDIPINLIFAAPSIRELAKHLGDHKHTSHSGLLITLSDKGQGTPIYWLPPSGGAPFCYAELAQRLGQDRPVHAFQARGLRDQETPFGSITAMAQHYLEVLLKHQPQGPMYLGGYSSGGVVAHELSRLLTEQGRTVQGLILLDAYPTVTGEAAPDQRIILANFLDQFDGDWNLGKTLSQRDSETAIVADAVLQELYEEAGEAASSLFDLQHLKRMFHTERAAQEALYQFKPTPFRAPPTLLCHIQNYRKDAFESWQKLLEQTLDTRAVKGDHQTLLIPPHIDALSEDINQFLQTRQQGENS